MLFFEYIQCLFKFIFGYLWLGQLCISSCFSLPSLWYLPNLKSKFFRHFLLFHILILVLKLKFTSMAMKLLKNNACHFFPYNHFRLLNQSHSWLSLAVSGVFCFPFSLRNFKNIFSCSTESLITKLASFIFS